MTCLPDINFWIALTVAEHVHHTAAKQWFESQDCEQIAFCRVTQMGFLRLLTNPRVMAGEALTPERAWNVFDAVCRDSRIFFSAEPPGLETIFRESTRRRQGGVNFWTDAYLSAFTSAAGFTLVTFDAGYARHKGILLQLLGTRG
jgi:toxin-antitoxin system PIN domain toxin